MSARDQLREEILKKAVVHGKVILSSGKEADYYVDLRRVTLDSTAAPLVGEVMLELTKDLDYEAVGGLTLGADPVATAMMRRKRSGPGTSSASSCLRPIPAAAASTTRLRWPRTSASRR